MGYGRAAFHALAGILLSVTSAGCVRSAHYDRPSLINPGTMEYSQLIPYRKLTRADFRASSRPEPLTTATVAAVCTQIVAAPDVRFRVLPIPIQHNAYHDQYEMIVVDPGFRGVVNPTCSWWEADGYSRTRVLEHEQVHFAIAELQARSLNWRIAQNFKHDGFGGETPMIIIRELLDETILNTLEMNERFDKEMFLSHESRSVRQTWLERLEAALRRTAAYAR